MKEKPFQDKIKNAILHKLMDTVVSENKVITAQMEDLNLTLMTVQNETMTIGKMVDMGKQASETANRQQMDATVLVK